MHFDCNIDKEIVLNHFYLFNTMITGASAIAHSLTKNTTLQVLNLRLNKIGDEGGQAICR